MNYSWLGIMSLLISLSASADTLRVGIVPQFSTLETAKTWNPVLQQLATITGDQYELVYYADIPTFEKAFLAGDTDVIYMNPYHAVMAFDAQGYKPVICAEKKLQGILVVRNDSNINKPDDLDHAKLVFPSPNAFGASLWMRAQLMRNFHLNFETVYVGTHQNVYRQVSMGDATAGGGVLATFNKESEALRQSLKIIYTTPTVASHPIAVHPRVSAAASVRLQQGILTMATSEEGQKKLAQAQLANPVSADYMRDYLPLKELDLQSLVK